jgi:CheY-like chemotaxis protein
VQLQTPSDPAADNHSCATDRSGAREKERREKERREKERREKEHMATAAPGFDWRTLRLLVVDGDDAFRFWARTIFRNVHVRDVLTAPSGPEGLAALSGLAPQVVLVEQEMPGMTGTEFIRRLRAGEGKQPTVPVILLAKGIDPAALREACRLGIEGFVLKPTNAEGLLKRVAAATRNPRRLVFSDQFLAALQARTPTGGSAGVPAPTGAVPPSAAAPRPVPKAPPAPSKAPVATNPVPSASPAPPASIAVPQAQPAPSAAPPPPKAKGGDNAIELAPPPAAPRRHDAAEWQAALGPAPAKEAAPPPKDAGIDLRPILAGHLAWLTSHGREGSKAILEGVDLHGMSLKGANLAGAVLRGVDLSDANCDGASFEGADLRRADLSSASMKEGVLAVSNLRHARLVRTHLAGANLRGADLAGAELAGAETEGADFDGANFLETNLVGADLSHAVGLTQDQIDRARCDATTRLPPGLFRGPTVDE